MSVATEMTHEEKKEQFEKKQLHERQLKRLAVFQKHEAILKLSCDTGNQIRWKRHFYNYTKMLSTEVFTSEEEEYKFVGKPNRLYYTDRDLMIKAYSLKHPMHTVFREILYEFGCFDY